MRRAAAALGALGLLAGTAAFAGGPMSVCSNGTPIKFPGAGNIVLNYDLGGLGTRTKAQADAFVTTAVSIWTNVATSTVVLGRGPDMPVDVTTANLATYYPNSAANTSDGLNPVIYDTDGSIIDSIFGAGAKNNLLGFATARFANCQFTEGVAFVSGFKPVSDTTLGVVFAHEIGHLMGLDHSQLDNSQGIAASANYPLMYPVANRGSLTLHEDDVAAVTLLYPDPSLNTVYGQITGTFVLGDGVTPVRGANLWAAETATGKVYSVVSDYLKQNTGFFRILLPAGTYTLHAEAVQSNFIGASSVGPYAELNTDPSFQPPMYPTGIGGAPLPPVTLGNAMPTPFRIAAGCSATLTFNINGSGAVGGDCPSFPGTLQFTAATASVGEAAGSVTLTVSRINGSDGPASVNVQTVGGTATAGADFTAQSATLNWAAGDATSRTLVVPIVNDALVEGNETFSVVLSSPAGATLGAVTSVTVTIVDDDMPTVPGPPQNVSAVAGDGQLFFQFAAPPNDGGAPVTSYTAACGMASVTGAAAPLTLSGLANDTLQTCSVTATNAVGSSAPVNLSATPTAGAPLALVGAVSRKMHGAAGPFDIVLDPAIPIEGAIGIEPRLPGAGHGLELWFNRALVSAGEASLAAPAIGTASVAAISGNRMTLQLAGVADRQRVRVAVSGVNGLPQEYSIAIGFLVGDFNATRLVAASDVAGLKAHAGQGVTAANFRFDVDASGVIDGADLAAVKNRSGGALP